MDWRLFLALAAVLFPAATAQLCTPLLGSYGYTYIVENQSEVDEIAAHCTTVNGGIMIAPNYTGSFFLPNVRNLTNGLGWFRVIGDPETEATPVSVELPDLEYAGSDLSLNGLPTLRNVSMPRLKTVSRHLNADYVYEADFRALETAEYVAITGNMSSLRLDSLREVKQKLRICNHDECDPDISPASSLDISLPSLQSVGNLKLAGRISSLDVPSLTTITGDGPDVYDFQFSTGGGPSINLTFPDLSEAHGEIKLTGDIASLDMPNLRAMRDTSLWLDTSADPITVDLPFDEAYDILLYGNISSVNFPNLTYLNGTFAVNSNLPLDCDSILNTISTATNVTVSPGGRLYCRSAEEPGGSGLSTGVKAAIGVVVGVCGLAIIVGAVFLLKRRQKKRQRLATESIVQLQDATPPAYRAREDGDDPVPEYVSRSSK
ncbi:hypothetical protein BDW62DRAFT_172899 [Aspergillus aurantiobrunneus]